MLNIHYTDFRESIYELLDEYDSYRNMPDIHPRVKLEDSIYKLLAEINELDRAENATHAPDLDTETMDFN